MLMAGYTDLKERRIPNIITLPFLLIGLLFNLIAGQYKTTLIGFSIALVLGVIMWLLGGMGGGDVKLMAGIGAWLGVMAYFNILFMASIIGVIWAGIDALKASKLNERILEIIVKYKVHGPLRINNIVRKQEGKGITIAFGTCLCIATLIYFITGGVYYKPY